MIRFMQCLAVAAALLTVGCAGQASFDDRSDEAPIRHRVPSK